MIILSIETSCDETAVSIIDARGTVTKPSFKLLGNSLYSQVKLHAKYGGVMPNLAKREHAKNLPHLLVETLKQAKFHTPHKIKKPLGAKELRGVLSALAREEECAKEIILIGESIKKPKIDAIAVTFGPGLEPALWVGITVAKALGAMWNIPVVPVNHMEGHIVSVLFSKATSQKLKAISYPSLALLISGGHTELVLSKSPLSYNTIGKTRDDALGEAYDKVARMMNLPYPGGPEVSKLADKKRQAGYKKIKWNLPRPMIHSGDFDFSFSGLKTAVLYAIQKHGKLTGTNKEELAKEFEDAVTEVIVEKTRKAIVKYKPKNLIIGGGVIANPHIRSAFQALAEECSIPLHIPERELATDNSVMIGMAGYLQIKKKPSLLKSKKPITAKGNVTLS